MDYDNINEMVMELVKREKASIYVNECRKCKLKKCDVHCSINADFYYYCETIYNAFDIKRKEPITP